MLCKGMVNVLVWFVSMIVCQFSHYHDRFYKICCLHDGEELQDFFECVDNALNLFECYCRFTLDYLNALIYLHLGHPIRENSEINLLKLQYKNDYQKQTPLIHLNKKIYKLTVNLTVSTKNQP